MSQEYSIIGKQLLIFNSIPTTLQKSLYTPGDQMSEAEKSQLSLINN